MRRTSSEEMVRVAADLLSAGGVGAVSTRAVAAAADVNVPTIYREFGDMDGLLDVVTAFVLRKYLRDKRKAVSTPSDPVVDLRRGWDVHVDFGLSQPDCYTLIYGRPNPGKVGSAATETIAILRQVLNQLGLEGRLRMSVERATRLLHAAAVGFVLTQIAMAPEERDQELSLIARESALRSIMNDNPEAASFSGLPGRAVALREVLRGHPDVPMTSVEGALLAEWLDRLADQMPSSND